MITPCDCYGTLVESKVKCDERKRRWSQLKETRNRIGNKACRDYANDRNNEELKKKCEHHCSGWGRRSKSRRVV